MIIVDEEIMELLRNIMPELPEDIKALELRLVVGEPVEVTVVFYPKEHSCEFNEKEVH